MTPKWLRKTDVSHTFDTFSVFQSFCAALPVPLPLPSCYSPALRPPVSQRWNLILTKRLLKSLYDVISNLKRVVQCSCLSSHRPKNGRSKYFIQQYIVALHLSRKYRLVSYSSSHREHKTSFFLFNRTRYHFNVLCPVRRLINILKSLQDNLKTL